MSIYTGNVSNFQIATAEPSLRAINQGWIATVIGIARDYNYFPDYWAGNFWQQDVPGIIYYTGYAVGINTAAPLYTLDVNGSIHGNDLYTDNFSGANATIVSMTGNFAYFENIICNNFTGTNIAFDNVTVNHATFVTISGSVGLFDNFTTQTFSGTDASVVNMIAQNFSGTLGSFDQLGVKAFSGGTGYFNTLYVPSANIDGLITSFFTGTLASILNLQSTNFTGTNIQTTAITGAIGSFATLYNTNFTGVNGSFSNLSSGNVVVSAITGAIGSFGTLLNTNFTGVNGSFSNLTSGDIVNNAFTGSYAAITTIKNTDFTGVNGSFTNLSATNQYIGSLTGSKGVFDNLISTVSTIFNQGAYQRKIYSLPLTIITSGNHGVIQMNYSNESFNAKIYAILIDTSNVNANSVITMDCVGGTYNNSAPGYSVSLANMYEFHSASLVQASCWHMPATSTTTSVSIQPYAGVSSTLPNNFYYAVNVEVFTPYDTKLLTIQQDGITVKTFTY